MSNIDLVEKDDLIDDVERVEQQENKTIVKEYRLKEVLASANINFLFGSGINGQAFPQLSGFERTNEYLEEKENGTSKSFEEKLNNLSNDDRKIAEGIFINEFNEFVERIDYTNEALKDISSFLDNVHNLVGRAENRQDSSYKVNLFTLNYDDILETILQEKGYMNNIVSADSYKRTDIFNVIGYNYEYSKKIPTFVTTKLHGSVKKGKLEENAIIYPGNLKYESALNSKFFETMFLMKSELIKQNAVLIVIGYSGNDEHLNGLISDAIESKLTVIWFKYTNTNIIPDSVFKHGKDKVIVIDQIIKEDKDIKLGTIKRCSNVIKEVLSHGNREDSRG